MDYALIFALVALIIWQQYFFMKQIDTLVNKLMSRNYAEYVQSQPTLEPTKDPEFKLQMDEDESKFLAELNGIVAAR